MRPATACHACRISKRKCRPPPTGVATACARCERQQLACSFVNHQSYPSIISTTNRLGTQETGSVDLHGHQCAILGTRSSSGWPTSLDVALRDEMVDHYFTVVHDTHHSLFHRKTFEANLREGRIADVILYAILSLGSRFVVPSKWKDQDLKRLEEDLAENAHRALDIRDVSVTTVQGCILLGTLCYADGQGAAEAVYYATAARIAIILDLPRRKCDSELERQVNLRVWWTLYMIDIWSSAGLQLSRQLSYREEAELPLDELVFLNLTPDVPHNGQQTRTVGIWGEMARLAYIWSLIQDLNKNSVEDNLSPTNHSFAIETVAQQLTNWREALPSFLQETPENLESMATRGLGTSFAALHLGYHYYHEVLFYQFMAQSRQHPSALADKYAAECARHARSFCDLLYLCERTEGCQCRYAMVGHMLVVTSTVYVHMLLFNAPVPSPTTADNSSDGGVNTLRRRLEHNFEILTNLQTHWATLDVSLARLRVFHNACLDSMENSFQMDRWMLRFILEHGSAMPEKFEVPSDVLDVGTATGDESITLQDWYTRTLL